MGNAGRLLMLVAVIAVAPNAFWLMRSTVRVDNVGHETLHFVVLKACDTKTALGVMEPGDYVFRVLPQCGDDTLIVSARGFEVCREYVEESLDHFRIRFSSPTEGDCERGSPPFFPLLLFELI